MKVDALKTSLELTCRSYWRSCQKYKSRDSHD